MRGGPGLGNIAPEQSDYFAMVKGGGHGNYRNIVLAPASVQEMAELTMLAFDLADKYRNPAVVLADGFIGQMMEPLDLEVSRDSAARENLGCKRNARDASQPGQLPFFSKPMNWNSTSAKWKPSTSAPRKPSLVAELCHTEDADVLLVGYGIVSRVLLSTLEALRKEGVKAGLFRPITLWPYPSQALAKAAAHVQKVLVVELSNGQMLEDVRLALNSKVPVEFYGRVGGNVPSVAELKQQVLERMAVAV